MQFGIVGGGNTVAIQDNELEGQRAERGSSRTGPGHQEIEDSVLQEKGFGTREEGNGKNSHRQPCIILQAKCDVSRHML